MSSPWTEAETERAVQAVPWLREALGGPGAWLQKRVLIAGPQPSLAVGAVLACHGADVTVLTRETWNAAHHPRQLRDLLLRLHAQAPDTDPSAVGQALRRGGFEADALRARAGEVSALAQAGEAYDVVVTWEPAGIASPNGLFRELVSVTAPGGWGVHRLACPEAEAGRALTEAGFELRSYRSDTVASAAALAVVACRRPYPVGPEYPTTDASAQILAHSAARYGFVSQFVRGRRVLDLGCGAGIGSRSLRAAGAASVHGIDKRDEAIALARGADPELADTYRQGDLNEALPYPDGSFDVAICLEVLEHVARQRELVQEIARVLAPDGIAVVSVPHEPFEHFWEGLHGESNPYHEHVPDVEEFRRLLSPFGDVSLFAQTDVVASVVLPLDPAASAPPVRGDASLHVARSVPLRDRDTLTIVAVCRRSGASSSVAPPMAVSYGLYQGELARLTQNVVDVQKALTEARHAAFRQRGFLAWALVAARRGRGEPILTWLGHGVRWARRTVPQVFRRVSGS